MTDVKNGPNFSKNFYYQVAFVLLFILIVRLFAMYFVPLIDTTEARYSEIAREMLSSHNWITLTHNNGIPFMAKPPLSTWLSVFFMQLFGLNELVLRLPSLLLSVAILWLVWAQARKQSGSVVAIISVVFLAGNLYFYLNAGTIMTDASLLFCTTLALIAFWRSMIDQSKLWSYLFFIALGLNLLAKGLIGIVLTGLPIFFWTLIRCQWRALWHNLPWIKGSLISLSIALPWYILAEIRTPGLINYFIIGEHFSRFYVPSWTGNKYGYSHAKPYGLIWGYGLVGLFPWSLVAGFWLLRHGKKLPSFLRQNDQGWLLYLLLWAYIPFLFFTFSRNIIYTYVFPSLPAFALLFAELWKRSGITELWAIKISYLTTLVAISFFVVTTIFMLNPGKVAKSQKIIVSEWKKQPLSTSSKLFYWATRLEYSAQFYSEGRVLTTRNLYYLAYLFAVNPDSYLVISSSELPQLPPSFLAKFTQIAQIELLEGTSLLFHNKDKIDLANLVQWR
ncbi:MULTISPECIES: ArnT family glycosyltransferase [Legionella]|uniref:Melitin resistance protein n=1 Tax=Legionella drozanskii LLAP-1 TaxID=1212489 RepID=A0A0W0SR01_9GAMM|nr:MULTISPECIES: glycosyltransferase family 39 protein [Legionella]KTC85413.1 melitin resistance protein [Legionella drozanskii LLAP-1]PJE16208.1 MAG: dolichyl-phosphate-mannose--protein mannosyltransferase [Legionella sp.]